MIRKKTKLTMFSCLQEIKNKKSSKSKICKRVKTRMLMKIHRRKIKMKIKILIVNRFLRSKFNSQLKIIKRFHKGLSKHKKAMEKNK